MDPLGHWVYFIFLCFVKKVKNISESFKIYARHSAVYVKEQKKS